MSELPTGWTLTTLASVASWGSGGTPKATNRTFYGGSIPWAVIGDLTDATVSNTTSQITEMALAQSSAKLVPQGTVLIAMYGSIGKLGIAGVSMATNQAIAFANPYAGVLDRRYLFHYLRSQRHHLNGEGKGATQQNISQTILKGWPIPLAPLPEQQRIVAAIEEQFSRLDAGVAALERARQNLKRMRTANLNSLLNDDAGKQWPLVKLGDVLIRGRYGTSTKCSYEGKGLPVLRIPNVQSGSVSQTDLKYSIDPSVDLSGTLVADGDVLVIRTNGSRSLIGRAAVVRDLPHRAAFASYLIQLQVDRELLDPAYLVAVLASSKLRADIEHLAATTAGQYNINLNKLRSLCIPLPPLAEQLRSLTVVDRELSISDSLQTEVHHISILADALRSSILAAAFTGKLISQDPTDEPASVLLERIAAEQESKKR